MQSQWVSSTVLDNIGVGGSGRTLALFHNDKEGVDCVCILIRQKVVNTALMGVLNHAVTTDSKP